MRVGTSIRYGAVVRDNKDHPHACGDKPLGRGEKQQILGSSPCVWGQAALTW